MNPVKIALLLANGCEEAEAIITADFLRRLKFDLTMASIGDSLAVTGAHDLKLTADRLLGTCPADEFSVIVLPGGMPGAANLKESTEVLQLLQYTRQTGGLIAAICAAPIVLEAAGVLAGKRFTCYPGFEKECASGVFTGKTVETDDRIITGRGPGAAFAFAARIAEELGKVTEAAAQLQSMLVTK